MLPKPGIRFSFICYRRVRVDLPVGGSEAVRSNRIPLRGYRDGWRVFPIRLGGHFANGVAREGVKGGNLRNLFQRDSRLALKELYQLT